MEREHVNFWIDLGGKVGPPIFAATLVGCLLSEAFKLTHAVLIGVGLALILVEHRVCYHRRRGPR